MATTGKYYDWPALVEKAKGLIRRGKIKPFYTDISDALRVPRNTLDGRFRSFGIHRDILDKPDQWPDVATRKEFSKPDGTGLDAEEAAINGIPVKKVIDQLRKGPHTLDQLADKLDRGSSVVADTLRRMSEAGYGVVRDEKVVKLPPYTPPQRAPVLSDQKSQHIRFAVASDWHIASKAAQISALRAFLDLAVKKWECKHILVPGDLTAGFGVYRGQSNEVYAQGATDQVDALINTAPSFPGVKYLMLGGNHDYSFMKANGFNVIEHACRLRDDWVYLGYDEAAVPLTPELDIVLWHPSGGVPYALSYRGQKFAAELAQRELVEIVVGKKERPKTRFIFWGHLHVAASFPHGPIQVSGPGCFEGRNSYLKQKGLTPMIQGVIVDVWLTADGMIQEYVERQMRYVEQEDDWKSAFIPSVARQAQERIVPMFKLKPTRPAAT